MEYWVSCGFGTQSSLLAIWAARDDPRLTKYSSGKQIGILAADTKDEWPETYNFLFNHLKPYIENLGRELIIVSNGELIDYYTQNNIIPSRMWRHCTEKFKIRPMRSYWRKLDLKKHGITQFLGITIDEFHRMRESDVQWITNVYPLVDLKLTREDCIREIMSYGLPRPPKSGCYCCPFSKKSEMFRLKRKYPGKFQRVYLMEKGAKTRNPKIQLIKNVSLDRVDRARTLDEFLSNDENCEEGYCFV